MLSHRMAMTELAVLVVPCGPGRRIAAGILCDGA